MVAHLAGRLAAHFKIPRIVGEISAGVLLGPTFLGSSAPTIDPFFFMAGKAALFMFMFSAGQETKLPTSWKEGRATLCVSLFGSAIPFLIAWGVACVIPQLFGSESFHSWFPLFLGTTLSISALPVIAKLFMDLHLEHTALASLVLSAATIDDVMGWGLFVMLFHHISPKGMLATIGFHAIFAAFIGGVLLRHLRWSAAARTVRHVAALSAPLYFLGTGLQIHLGKEFSVLPALVLLAVASVGKVFGAGIGARLTGLSWRNAGAVGFAMNARGAMGIIFATTALEQGLIGLSLHAGLVFVALATSLIAAPGLNLLYDPGGSNHEM